MQKYLRCSIVVFFNTIRKNAFSFLTNLYETGKYIQVYSFQNEKARENDYIA